MTALITALGVAQIVSWGTLFYAIGVLGAPMRQELGVSELFLFGSFTAGLLLSGAVSPLAGRAIDRRGGKFVLSVGSALGFVACLVLAMAPNAAVMLVGWLVAGLAMAACLYDPAFATLAQLTGPRYRKAVTALTLFGGFASTVFWPLSHVLLEGWGWRATWGVYAALHLLVCLPIHRVFVHARGLTPAPGGLTPATEAGVRPLNLTASADPLSPAFSDPRLNWLAASLAIATFVFGVIAVHLIRLLTAAGLTEGQAVTISMLVGPMQVAGRLIELGLSGRTRAATVGYFVFVLMGLALGCLILVDGMGVLAVAFVVAYGFANGVLTIIRGTVPVELFGREGLGGLLGYISRAVMGAKAIAPAAFSGLLAIGLARNSALAIVAGVALLGLGTYAMAIRRN